MNLKRIDSIDRYREITELFSKKGCLSNDYIQGEADVLIEAGKVFEYIEGENAFLFVKKDVGLRLYYYLNDLASVPVFDVDDDLVVEILFRGEAFYPEAEIDYLQRCGFEKHILRDQYSAMYKNITLEHYDVPGLSIRLAENIEEVEYAVGLFNTTFDNYTGNFIPMSECARLLEERCILIARLDGKLAGAMHFTRAGKLIWAEHNVVEPWCRGRHVGSMLCNAFVETAKVDDNTRYTRWTQHGGQAARMYEKIGFKYINKSSFSMLKLRDRTK